MWVRARVCHAHARAIVRMHSAWCCRLVIGERGGALYLPMRVGSRAARPSWSCLEEVSPGQADGGAAQCVPASLHACMSPLVLAESGHGGGGDLVLMCQRQQSAD